MLRPRARLVPGGARGAGARGGGARLFRPARPPPRLRGCRPSPAAGGAQVPPGALRLCHASGGRSRQLRHVYVTPPGGDPDGCVTGMSRLQGRSRRVRYVYVTPPGAIPAGVL
eukprot:627817-Prorocentrum_minimum.AAC.1